MVRIRVTVCNKKKMVCSVHDHFTIQEAMIHILHTLRMQQEIVEQEIPSLTLLSKLNNVDDAQVIDQFGLYESNNEFELNEAELVRDVLQNDEHVQLRFKLQKLNVSDNDEYYPNDKFSLSNVSSMLKKSVLNEFDDNEKKTRIELAACYRLFDRFGWTDTIYGHLTARVTNGDESYFLINPFGLLYDEITASSLVKVDLKGDIIHQGVIGDVYGINRAGYVIHSAIHEYRHDIQCVMHTHFAPSSALSCLNQGFNAELSQTAQILGGISYHDYEGIAVDQAERERLAKSLGPTNQILILKNHGVVVCGRTIAEAFLRMYTLTEAAKIQVHAYSAAISSDDVIPASEELANKTFQISSGFNKEGFGVRELCAYMRKLDSIDKSYRQ
jgi:adducin